MTTSEHRRQYRQRHPDRVMTSQQKWRAKQRALVGYAGPWACPKFGKTFKPSGKGGHAAFCDPYKDVELFNAKVLQDPNSDCWLFMGARVPAGGYGRFRFNKRLIAAHRVAYMLAYGNIPAGLDVMHHCDNPPCCNPAHLKAATTLENMQDAKRKGRMYTGGNKPRQQVVA